MLYFGRRELSPFSTREWRTTPWRAREKSIKDLLVDILDDIPGLLQQLDKVQGLQYGAKRDELLQKLHLRCREIEVTLNAWKRRVGNDLQRFDYTTTSLPIAPPDSDVEFALLHLTSLYWVACLLLYSTLGFASRQGSPYTPQRKPRGAYELSMTPPLAALSK
ncbi:dnaK protein [Purpureocillium lavendulum]|uniref:DnaK protein n=1 Tax=Purpureocillium lavendulum TaxID=1247861 RepID=A0AB34FLC9_9HYPO|nr:dnaK protein [Purpureocillium lavendulum]